MTIDFLHFVLLAAALFAAGAALWLGLRGRPDTAGLSAEISRERQERAAMKAERDEQRTRAETAERRLEAQTARMAEREAGMAREREQLAKQQQEVEGRFKTLASAALADSQKAFVELAQQTLKQQQEGARGELGEMLKPIQATFGEFREKVEAIQKVSTEDRARLEEQIKQVGKSVSDTQAVAGKLATALSAPRGGGRWGEETLRNVLEMAGLSSLCRLRRADRRIDRQWPHPPGRHRQHARRPQPCDRLRKCRSTTTWPPPMRPIPRAGDSASPPMPRG